ncbi:hypothetical protein HOL24_00025 [bacterium]|jgi:putative flippase GtrA|nr:hypothetical protein [bacterium]
MKSFFRFAVVGGITTMLSYSVYSLLIYFEIVYYLSSFFSNVIGFIFNILIVRLYVFKVKIKISLAEIRLLTLIWIVGVVAHIYIIKFLYIYGINYYLGGIVATAFILFWNYFSRKQFYKKSATQKI